MSRHNELKKRAVEAIEKLFSDTSVPREQTREALEGLKDEIDARLETIDDFLTEDA
jgi:hypothetical protein